MHPHKVIWNWDISFGNILSIILTIGAVAAAMIGGYVRYEKKFIQTDERITHVEAEVFSSVELISGHAEKEGVHISKAESTLEFVPRAVYEAKESEQDTRIRAAQLDLKADLTEIKGMVRDNGKAGLEQYRQITSRIDQIVDQ